MSSSTAQRPEAEAFTTKSCRSTDVQLRPRKNWTVVYLSRLFPQP